MGNGYVGSCRKPLRQLQLSFFCTLYFDNVEISMGKIEETELALAQSVKYKAGIERC